MKEPNKKIILMWDKSFLAAKERGELKFNEGFDRILIDRYGTTNLDCIEVDEQNDCYISIPNCHQES